MKKTFIASTIYSSWQFKAYWNSQVIQRCYQLNAYSNSWRSDKHLHEIPVFQILPLKLRLSYTDSNPLCNTLATTLSVLRTTHVFSRYITAVHWIGISSFGKDLSCNLSTFRTTGHCMVCMYKILQSKLHSKHSLIIHNLIGKSCQP
jgi:hypothetical protein